MKFREHYFMGGFPSAKPQIDRYLTFLYVATLFRFRFLILASHITVLRFWDKKHLVMIKKTSWFVLKYLI